MRNGNKMRKETRVVKVMDRLKRQAENEYSKSKIDGEISFSLSLFLLSFYLQDDEEDTWWIVNI